MKDIVLVLLMFFSSFLSYGYEGEAIKLKSSSTAVKYSVGATLLPVVPGLFLITMGHDYVDLGGFLLCLSGFFVGPSVGHFYAGNSERAMASIGLRSACLFAGGLSTLLLGGFMYSDNDVGAAISSLAIIALGVGILWSAAYDIRTCPRSVEKYNESVRDYGGFHLTPEIDVKDKSYGLSLVYKF